GFCNAILRAIARHDRDHWLGVVAAGAPSGTARLAAVHSHPEWVVEALAEALAADGRPDDVEVLLEADNRSPSVVAIDLDRLGTDPPPVGGVGPSPYAIELGHGDPTELVLDSGGRVRVQDPGSQIAALTLTRAREVRPGERW